MSTRTYGTVGFVGAAYWVVVVLALHALDRDTDPVYAHISDYALGDVGWLMQSAFVAAGIGTLAIAIGFYRSFQAGKRVRPAIVLQMIAGLGFVLAGVFNTDPTPLSGAEPEMTGGGTVHVLAALALFISVIVAAFLLRGVFERNESWRPLSRRARWFAIAMALTLAGSIVTPGDEVGIGQRIFVVPLFGWPLTLGWHMRGIDETAASLATEP